MQYKEGKEYFESEGYFVQVLKRRRKFIYDATIKQLDSDFMNSLSMKVLNSISDGITIGDRNGKYCFKMITILKRSASI